MEVILYSKECNWYTRCCPLNGGVRYRECPLYCTCTIMTSCVCACHATSEIITKSFNYNSVYLTTTQYTSVQYNSVHFSSV